MTNNGMWALRGRTDDSSAVHDWTVDESPFVVGRRLGVQLSIPRRTVSQVHAELNSTNGELWVRDLKSTNGTFVNGCPVTKPVKLNDGDLLQFADAAFRVSHVEKRVSEGVHSGTLRSAEQSCDRAFTLMQFDKLMNERAVVPHFQPIVNLADGAVVGYEVLGRSRLWGMQTPKDMFLAASQLNLEAELSRMLRTSGVERGLCLLPTPNLFVNTHPAELQNFGLLESLRELREKFPDQPVTLEVHEAAVVDVSQMQELRAQLDELNFRLAFDDFGAGQSRLIELVDVRPDYVKFDHCMVHAIETASKHQRQMLGALVQMTHDLGIVPLAEGVETAGEHAVCVDLGFKLGQGYYYGRPATVQAVSANEISEQLELV